MSRHARRGLLAGALILAWAGAAAASDALAAGIALYQQGKYAEAEAQLRTATASGTEAEAYLAAALARQKKHGEAESLAKAVLEKSPTHEVAVAALGEALVGLKKYDEVVERMSTAIKSRGDLAYAFYWRAQGYYNKKQPDRMVSDLETFLKLLPKAPEAPSVQQLLQSLR